MIRTYTSHYFPTSEAAWQFLRDTDKAAGRIVCGYPDRLIDGRYRVQVANI